MKDRTTETTRRTNPWAAGLLALVLGAGVVACDDDDEDIVEPPPVEPTEFTADLSPLNESGTTGTATFTVDEEGDQFTAEVVVNDAVGGTEVLHPQHIHAAEACPGAEQDANADGFVDVLEGAPVYGEILMPLDGQLTDPAQQAESFPTGTSYTYQESAGLEAFVSAYQTEDTDPEDPFTTLGPDGELNLEGRTVVVHGIPTDSMLPETVASIGELPPQVTLPIACGPVNETG